MAHYFSYVSDFNYVSLLPNSKISDYTTVKNFFRRGQIASGIFSNLAYFENYSIEGDERPDQVAQKFYDDPTLDWVVFLSNNIINVQDEWPLPSYVFDKVMLQKYGSYDNLYSGIHHYQTEEIKNSLGITMLKERIRLSPTWKTNGNFIEVINAKINTLTSDGVIGTITLVNGIVGLEEGTQITLANISEREYNGQFIISNILEETDNLVTSFEFLLNEIPNDPEPTLAIPRVEEVHFTLSENSTFSANSYYYEFYDQGLGYTVHTPKSSFVRAITNYEYEMDKEDKKRDIYLIKPAYLGIMFEDIENIMRYKKSSQYESRTLKKGDNIRLYN
jgi:hypothetical protein